MTKHRSRSVVIETAVWNQNGEQPAHEGQTLHGRKAVGLRGDGQVVAYYRKPESDGAKICMRCGAQMRDHGWIQTLEGGYIVCPGQIVITGILCKPDVVGGAVR